jgi:hypothetical protein
MQGHRQVVEDTVITIRLQLGHELLGRVAAVVGEQVVEQRQSTVNECQRQPQ